MECRRHKIEGGIFDWWYVIWVEQNIIWDWFQRNAGGKNTFVRHTFSLFSRQALTIVHLNLLNSRLWQGRKKCIQTYLVL